MQIKQINKTQLGLITAITEYMLNKLTPLYFKIYYKEENYIKVRTVVFKYITPPYNKG